MKKSERYHYEKDFHLLNLFLSKKNTLFINPFFSLLKKIRSLSLESSEQSVALAQISFWREEIRLLSLKKRPHHPLSLKLIDAPIDWYCLDTMIEAVEWQILRVSLKTEQDFTNYCSKLSSYFAVCFNQYFSLQPLILDLLGLCYEKIKMLQWIGFDREYELCMLPENWHYRVDEKNITDLMIESIHTHFIELKNLLIVTKQKLSLKDRLFINQQTNLFSLLKKEPLLLHSHYIKSSYINTLSVLVSSFLKDNIRYL
jgi:hypothetical protein